VNSKQHNKSQEQYTKELKEIPKWVRRYAQNRTLTGQAAAVIAVLFGMVVAVVVAFPWVLAAAGLRRGNVILGCVGIVVSVAIHVSLLVYILGFFRKNPGLMDQKIDQWIYGRDGSASIPVPKLTKTMEWLDIVGGAAAVICMLGSMYLMIKGYIACKYVQPVSALYLVPALVSEYLFRRPKVGPLVLLCPILYAIHAILIVAGVPIFFAGDLCMFTIFLPLLGYAFLGCVIGHLYSRYALKKLRGIAHLEERAANGD
jgi:hypothetical protein